MDREAAVIRSEMSQTRADLDWKPTQLRQKAREITPRQYAQRFLPPYLLDRTIGAVLTLIGVRMVLRHFRRSRRAAH